MKNIDIKTEEKNGSTTLLASINIELTPYAFQA